MLIVLAIAGTVLVACRAARVEATASANHVAAAQAAAAERAAEQYAMALVAEQRESVLGLDESYFRQRPVGTSGYFWIVRPDYAEPGGFGDEPVPLFGLVDEASKINLNSATPEMLLTLGAPQSVAYSVVDWRDGDDTPVSADGAEHNYYKGPPGYHRCKNGPLETVEELLLVRDVTPQLLDGLEPRRPLGVSRGYGGGGGGTLGDDRLARGLFDYVTVYSREPPDGGRGRPRVGRINVNTAPRAVLRCLPGLNDDDVTKLINQRSGVRTTASGGTGSGSGSGGAGDMAWVGNALGAKAGPVAPLVTNKSYQYSARIVAASADGRAYRSCRIVIDVMNAGAPRILYRRDLTEEGWPLDPAILSSLRAGAASADGNLSDSFGPSLGSPRL